MNKTRILFPPARNHAEPDGNADVNGGQDDLGAILNNLNDDGTDPNAETTNTNSDVGQGDSDTGDGNDANTGDESEGQSKADRAFAQMRIQLSEQKKQNEELTSLIRKLANAEGLDPKNLDNVKQGLNDKALDKISTRDKVPKEYLERMERIEGENAIAKQERLQRNAVIGFQNVATKYGLDQAKLEAFAAELDGANKNPFTNEGVDIVAMYQSMHYDEILQARVDAALQEALAKDNKANNQSSTPNKNTGGQGNSGEEKITTVSGLRNALSNINL